MRSSVGQTPRFIVVVPCHKSGIVLGAPVLCKLPSLRLRDRDIKAKGSVSLNFEKKSTDDSKNMKNYQACTELIMLLCSFLQRAQEIQRVIERETELSLQHGVRQLKEIGQSLILSK